MWNKPNENELKALPPLYSVDNENRKSSGDIPIVMHFWIGGFDWYISEIDHENLDTMFGYANLADDQNAEWGYISLSELEELKSSFVEVDRDLYWEVRPAGEVENIKRSGGVFDYSR